MPEKNTELAPVRPLPVVRQQPQPVDSPAMLVRHYLWVVRRRWWALALLVGLASGAAWWWSKQIAPLYEATASIDLDLQAPTGVIGDESRQMLSNNTEQFLQTQLRLVQSDSVLRPVAARFNLIPPDPPAEPGRPLVKMADRAVNLPGLTVSRPGNTQVILVSYRAAEPVLAAEIANAVATSYIEHTYRLRFQSAANVSSFMEKQIDELKQKMDRSGAALSSFEADLQMVNPEGATTMLSSRLLQLNTELTNAQIERVRKEAAYNAVKNGSLESAQASPQGETARRLAERLDEARQKFEILKTSQGSRHPEYQRAAAEVAQLEKSLEASRQGILKRVESEFKESAQRESMLNTAVASAKAEVDRANKHSLEYESLKREADSNKKLYEQLVQRIKEGGINAGFQNNVVRLADPARPNPVPVSPNTRNNVIAAALLALFLGIVGLLVTDAMDNTVRDPEVVSHSLGTDVVGSLPLVNAHRGWLTMLPLATSNGNGLSHAGRGSFDEAIYSLRNSILLAERGRVKSLLFTSAAPGEGKTTTAAHIAAASARVGRKTLLIDADLRRPSLWHIFEYEQSAPGLADVISRGIDWRSVLVRNPSVGGLDILAAGSRTGRRADIIGNYLPQILDEASDYDLIIIDSTPILSFPEPMEIASLVDGIVIVTRAGKTDRKAVAAMMQTLRRLGAHVVGVVVNAITGDLNSRYPFQGYSGKYYREYHAADRKN